MPHASFDVKLLLCGLLLLARLGDIGTTWLATPSLKLESNPIVKRLGWKFGLATLLLCFVPLLHPGFGLTFAVTSLLVSASNASRLWEARAMGEAGYEAFLIDLARKSRFLHAAASLWISAIFVAGLGAVGFAFYPEMAYWGFWFALGLVVFAIAIVVHGTLHLRRIFREARAHPAPDAQPAS